VKRILIIDNDLGFVFWLGQALDAAGYDTLPAKGVAEATELLAHVRGNIDVLIVRYSTPGAESFVADLRWTQRGQLKAIALIDSADQETASLPGWDAWQLKPALPDESARITFLKLVQTVELAIPKRALST
jgi:DNA-binding NtrC family response regulator